jgi:hypothetical protein
LKKESEYIQEFKRQLLLLKPIKILDQENFDEHESVKQTEEKKYEK